MQVVNMPKHNIYIDIFCFKGHDFKNGGVLHAFGIGYLSQETYLQCYLASLLGFTHISVVMISSWSERFSI